MVVHDFNVNGIAIYPYEADPPLIIDPDAVLTAAGALQCFQSIGGGTRRSFNNRALFSMRSLRLAICWMSCGKRFERTPFQIFSVSLERKLLIMKEA